MIRFARNQTLYLYQILVCALNTAGPARGWPYSIAPRIPPGQEVGKCGAGKGVRLKRKREDTDAQPK